MSRRRRHPAMAVDVAGDIAVTMFARRSVGCTVEEVHVLALHDGEWMMLGGGGGRRRTTLSPIVRQSCLWDSPDLPALIPWWRQLNAPAAFWTAVPGDCGRPAAAGSTTARCESTRTSLDSSWVTDRSRFHGTGGASLPGRGDEFRRWTCSPGTAHSWGTSRCGPPPESDRPGLATKAR